MQNFKKSDNNGIGRWNPYFDRRARNRKNDNVECNYRYIGKERRKGLFGGATGRAAQRMAAVTGREAKTIHRLLEVQWDTDDKPTFKRNEKNCLNAMR